MSEQRYIPNTHTHTQLAIAMPYGRQIDSGACGCVTMVRAVCIVPHNTHKHTRMLKTSGGVAYIALTLRRVSSCVWIQTFRLGVMFARVGRPVFVLLARAHAFA